MRIMIALAALCGLTALASGCTVAAQSDALVPTGQPVERRHSGSVSLAVSGGEDSHIWYAVPKITNEAFTAALAEAIRTSKVFAQVVEQGPADYLLEVSIRRFSGPADGPGGTADAQLVATWKLVRGTSRRPIWEDLITTSGSASPSDSWLGMTKGRMAVERAGQKDIRTGIQEISRLHLE